MIQNFDVVNFEGRKLCRVLGDSYEIQFYNRGIINSFINPLKKR